MIDILLRGGAGLCEVCQRRPATRKARFTAQYLESMPVPPVVEERVVSVQLERRVCERCLANLQKAKNVANLTFERL